MWPGSSQVRTLGSFQGCSEALIGSRAPGYWLQGRAVDTAGYAGRGLGTKEAAFGGLILPSLDGPILFPGEPGRKAQPLATSQGPRPAAPPLGGDTAPGTRCPLEEPQASEVL